MKIWEHEIKEDVDTVVDGIVEMIEKVKKYTGAPFDKTQSNHYKNNTRLDR